MLTADRGAQRQRTGRQRDWIWRGWQTRYSYRPAAHPAASARAPLMLLHGFGASLGHWRHNMPALSQQRPVYALDLLGFGASRKAATDYSVDLWVAQTYDFWQTFVGTPAVLVGNSIGALVSAIAAARHPEMVAGVVLLSLPDVSLRQQAIPRWMRPAVTAAELTVASPPLLRLLFALLRRPRWLRRGIGLAYADQRAIDAELVELLAAPTRDAGAARTFVRLFRAFNRPDFTPPTQTAIPQIAAPILLLWGLQDRMVPPRLAHRFRDLNPQLQLVEVAGAGHCLHDEQPERFHRILLDWLAATVDG